MLKIKRAKTPKCQVQGAMFQENLFLYQFNFSLNLKNKGVGLTSDHYVKWDSSSSNYYSLVQNLRRHATLGTCKLQTGQTVLNKEISLITNYLKQSKTKQKDLYYNSEICISAKNLSEGKERRPGCL